MLGYKTRTCVIALMTSSEQLSLVCYFPYRLGQSSLGRTSVSFPLRNSIINTVNCQIIARAFICFNHQIDRASIWDQAAIRDRRLIPSSQKSCSAKLGEYDNLLKSKIFYCQHNTLMQTQLNLKPVKDC